jgi:hypothetical protein
VVKHVDAAQLRVNVATDSVLVAQHLLKIGAHLVTALARLRVRNLSRRNSLEAGNKREKRVRGEELRNLRISVWLFGTGNRKCWWNARVYPEQEN